MALFKVIEVSKTTEKETQSIYDSNSLDEAICKMHNDFGATVKLETTIGMYAAVVDNTTGANAGSAQWGEAVRDRVYTHNNVDDDNMAYYETEQLAIGNYHTKLASQRTKQGVTMAITIRLNGNGEFVEFDSWKKPEKESTPTE